MKKITDVGRNLRREGNQLVSHPIALGGRADLYNGFRTMNNPRFAHSGDRVPDLYQVMIDYHLKDSSSETGSIPKSATTTPPAYSPPSKSWQPFLARKISALIVR